MPIVESSPTRLVVVFTEPIATRVVATLCLGLILLGPTVLPYLFPTIDSEIPGEAKAILASVFVLVVLGVLAIGRYSETYTFDSAQERLFAVRKGVFGTRQQTAHFGQIQELLLETVENSESADYHYVTLVLAPRGERLRLPRRISSSRREEQQELGRRLATFLRMPVRTTVS